MITIEAYRARVTELEAQRNAVLALHSETNEHHLCANCLEYFPCSTRRLLGAAS